MSLVNQMLRDLEQRRADLPRGEQMEGLRAAPTHTGAARHRRWPLLLMIAGVSGSGFGWWMSDHNVVSAPPPMARAAPIAPLTEAVPETVATASATSTPAIVTPTEVEPVLAAQESTLERAAVAALEFSTPRGSEPSPAASEPQPKPAPIIVRAKPVETKNSVAVMHKTPRTLSPSEQADQYYDTALRALADNDVTRAESALREALNRDAGHAKAAETLATLMLQQGQRDAASRILTTALEQSPLQSRLAMLQARLFAEVGRDTEAVGILQLAQANGDAEFQALLGALQQRLGNHSQAAIAYRQALTSAPQRGVWWLGLGISLEQDQKSAEALTAYRNALRDAALETQVSNYVRARIAALGNGQG